MSSPNADTQISTKGAQLDLEIAEEKARAFMREAIRVKEAKAYTQRPEMICMSPELVQRLTDLHWREKLAFHKDVNVIEGVENPFVEGSRGVGDVRDIPEEVPVSPMTKTGL